MPQIRTRHLQRRAVWLGAAIAVAAVWGGCSGSDRAPPPSESSGQGGTGGALIEAGFNDGPPDADASGYCGNQFVPVVIDAPNLYFILDRSGSMGDDLEGSSFSKYTNARIAMRDVLRAVGHRVNVGAAVFPEGNMELGCSPGQEIFSTRPGDPPWEAEAGDGKVLSDFIKAVSFYQPGGGTPTAATLTALTPTLADLDGDTYVVLATDGAPNCNGLGSCGADKCLLNIENISVGTLDCDETVNCCDPAVLPDGQFQCVDDVASVAAVSALSAADVTTYVVGMPGADPYADVLNAMAVAGGAPRAGSTKYFAVNDTEGLSNTLLAIGIEIAVSCTIELESAPPDPKLVNVYFDKSVVPGDPDEGWTYTNETTVELRGSACDRLKSGEVRNVQIVAGCPTEIL